jgi:hypothetical protein
LGQVVSVYIYKIEGDFDKGEQRAWGRGMQRQSEIKGVMATRVHTLWGTSKGNKTLTPACFDALTHGGGIELVA